MAFVIQDSGLGSDSLPGQASCSRPMGGSAEQGRIIVQNRLQMWRMIYRENIGIHEEKKRKTND